MNESVILQWNESLLNDEGSYGTFANMTLTEEINKWLQSNVCDGNFTWGCYWGINSDNLNMEKYLKFWFKEPQHALLFKLRWDGK